MKRWCWKLAMTMALGLLCQPVWAVKEEIHCITGKVSRVYDGDTIWVKDATYKKHKIRLNRIDAPEAAQTFGTDSMRYLYRLVFGKRVIVEYQQRDDMGRILGIVKLDGKDINLKMVRDGYAWHYKYFDKTREYAEAEKYARENKLGLWAKAGPIEPYQFRRQHKDLPVRPTRSE